MNASIAPISGLYEPSLHGVKARASELAAAAEQKPPVGHGSHSVALLAALYLPGGQGVHAVAPAVSEKEPAVQYVGCIEPVPHELPAGHGLHSAAELRSVALE